ncbi:MAG: signal peptidase I [Halobacteriota archaeon]|nr:signal peptidase I [Halobacteriota archaeon]
MNPLIRPILIALAITASMSTLFYIYYLMVFKRFDAPILLFSRTRDFFKTRSYNNKVEAKMLEYKIASKEEKSTVLSSVLILAIFVIIVFVLLFDVVYLVAITSNSMRPTFERDDLVLMQRINTDPEIGDVILFEKERYIVPITHRIISISGDDIRTQGDGSGNPDPWVVKEEDIKAKAVQVGGRAVVIKDIGDYFILETEQQSYGKYGQEYTFIKNMFMMIKLYGYVLCIIAVVGYVFLTVRESK